MKTIHSSLVTRHSSLFARHSSLVAALALASASASAATFHGVDDGSILSNPGMGLTMHYYSNVPDNYGSKLEQIGRAHV